MICQSAFGGQARSEIERYRGYRSADEWVTNFKRDLSSSAAKKVNAELRALHLPTIEDIRDEFDAKASELGMCTARERFRNATPH